MPQIYEAYIQKLQLLVNIGSFEMLDSGADQVAFLDSLEDLEERSTLLDENHRYIKYDAPAFQKPYKMTLEIVRLFVCRNFPFHKDSALPNSLSDLDLSKTNLLCRQICKVEELKN